MTKLPYIKLNQDVSLSKIRTQRPYNREWNEHKINKGQKVIIAFERKRYFGIVLSVSIKLDPNDHFTAFKSEYPGEVAFEMVIDIRKVLDNGN